MVNDVSSCTPNHNQHLHLQNPNSDESHHVHLRLALGSILSPKRPHSAQSSVSGTASPTAFGHYAHRPSHSPPDHSVYPPPSMTSATHSASSSDSSSQSSSLHGSPLHRPMLHDHVDTIVSDVHPPAPMNSHSTAASRPPLAVVCNDADHVMDSRSSTSGERTPSGRFIATLQSKSAWDALIHGSMV